jgi:cytochrome c peroxidase
MIASRKIASQKTASRRKKRALLALLLLGLIAGVIVIGCGSSGLAPDAPTESDATPPADPIGEALFLDTRFGEFFAANMTGVNDPLPQGDPVVAQVQNVNGGPMTGPFAGQAINCRSCHFVTEFEGVPHAGNRTYSDFTTRSPIPRAMNGFDHTPRNAMQMVDSMTARSGPMFLHFDGEFATPEDLVIGTMTGRNFGWTPAQYNQAIAHIAQVIRQDDGSSQLAADRLDGLSYSVIFKGTDPRITSDILLPPSQRIDVQTATDAQVVNEVALCIGQYMKDLLFQRDQFGRYIGSPYDNFLRVNHLQAAPLAGQSKAVYNQSLLQQVMALKNPIYITPGDGSYKYHNQPYQFGALELQGLKIFLSSAASGAANAHAGNCAACHQAPDFSDFVFHNNGVSQEEYDAAHGQGAFASLFVPTNAQRLANFNAYMPASPAHPNAAEAMRHIADPDNPQFADLGLWNIYLNPDVPTPQANIKSYVCGSGKDCSVDQGLASTIAQFKTPVLRDLEDSAPYFHNGSALTFNDVINHYIQMSELAHSGAMRNPPPEFANMSINQDDMAALVAFLQSLTEDYDDT